MTTVPHSFVPVTPEDRKRAAYFGLHLPPDPEPNPRDSWPAWTDEYVWELGPEQPEPTDFEPSAADEAARLNMIAEQEHRDEQLRVIAYTDYLMAEREETIAIHLDRWDAVNPNELIEARGWHPSARFDDAA